MEPMQGMKGYSDSREEEEEDEAAEEITITREESSSSKHYYPFSSPSFSLSSSPSISNHTTTPPPPHHHLVNNIPWLRMIHENHESSDATTTTESHNSSSGLGLHQQEDQDYAASNFINHTKQIDFMDLSQRSNKDIDMNGEANFQGSSHATSSSSSASTEKEHMFDKVVTPSDVGKLNRLVIPKQHAEKYFPLDSTSNEKGLLLNFEDRNGKLWRFRYSYWNSSQSYVMTKGWSRFVKEKKLDAGDIVSFQRGVGDLYRHRLYIDWRRRPDQYQYHHHGGRGTDSSNPLITPLFLPNQPHSLSQYSIRWGGRLYSQLPSPQPPRHHHHDHLQHLNCNNNMYPFHQQQQQQLQHHGGGGISHHYNYNNNEVNSSGSGSFYYLRSTPSMPMGDQSLMTRQQQQQQQEGAGNYNIAPMIIDSVPVAHHHQQQQQHREGNKSGNSSSSNNTNTTAGKRLRLFGVNMECGSSSSPSEDPRSCCSLLSSSTSVPHVTMANSSLLIPSFSSSSSLPPLLHQRLRVPHEDPLNLISSSTRFGDQRGEASMLFDLDPSLQYHRQ